MIEQLQGFPEYVVAFVGRGQVTKADYVSTLIPAVEKALAGRDRLRLYYELGADFTGIDADAIMEDFKIGMQHLTRWERAAVVTDVQWIAHAVSLFSFLMPGAIKVFSTKDANEARSWIVSSTL
jgi:phosphoserine phosphatase